MLNPTLGIAGVCTNVINAAVFLKQGLVDGLTLTFLIPSVSDGLYALGSLVGSAGFILKTDRGPDSSGLDPQLVYLGAYLGSSICHSVSVTVTVFVAVVRCYCVPRQVHPHHQTSGCRHFDYLVHSYPSLFVRFSVTQTSRRILEQILPKPLILPADTGLLSL